MLATLIAFTAAGHIAVVEAPTADRPRDPETGQAVARALGAVTPAEAGAALADRLPPVMPGGKSEPVLEAERLFVKGRDAYLDGKFEEATTELAQARDVLGKAIESFEEERQAAETLFKAHMYLAFTLHARGGSSLGEATEAMKEALRTFPNLEPTVAEYGPENIKFYRQVRQHMESGPTGRLRVRTPGEQASVYLNGRLVGVTPLELRRVFAGRYRLHLRQGSETSRQRIVELGAGDNEIEVDPALDRALRTDGGAALVYPSATARKAQLARHAVEVAQLLGADGVLAYWSADGRVHMAMVDRHGNARYASCAPDEAGPTALALRDGRIGEVVKGGPESPRRIWTWVAGGVAVAALATGVVLGLSYNSDVDDLNKKYPDGVVRDPKDFDTIDSARSKGTAANVMFGVAGAAAVTGAILFFYEGRAASEHALVPTVGPHFAGAAWRSSF
ncbi:MAG TPA: PEGA domain-containing protein [Polyangia bacterium]|nr:PEGA domain-containing protein [Polyangia bacterium]